MHIPLDFSVNTFADELLCCYTYIHSVHWREETTWKT